MVYFFHIIYILLLNKINSVTWIVEPQHIFSLSLLLSLSILLFPFRELSESSFIYEKPSLPY